MDVLTNLLVQVLPVIVAVLGPTITEIVKSKIVDVPKPVIPIVSVSIGSLIGYLAGYDFGNSVALGAAGSAIHNVLDQIKKAVDASDDEDPAA